MHRASMLHTALFIASLGLSSIAFSQTESAAISGKVTDASGAVIAGAQLQIQSIERGTVIKTTTNNSGVYVFSGVRPGHYNIEIQHPGFRQVDVLGLTVNVQDRIEENFQLQVGSSIESVSVRAETPLLNTEDATLSTVIDRNFAENLPMNGRSFQTLIELTPGVVLTPSTDFDNGQFSVNGQRATSNYWTVDGVSANIGTGVSAVGAAGNALGGAIGSFSAQGGTNSLVSVDALQEFRVQTSTYAPEFGRSPGAQISIVTRSGTNNFHGTVFDYLRNDVLDANDWFAGFAKLPKPEERQNDFGATFSGPVIRDRTFFFFSYEGLRLRLPQTVLSTVPDLAARQSALPAVQPYFNAYPRPNGTDDPMTSAAQFNATFSNRSLLDAYSLRVDHFISQKFSIFGRYNYSPSELLSRGGSGAALSSVTRTRITTQTATVGFVTLISPLMNNDVRLNFSRVDAKSSASLDNFGGAVPLTSLPFPAPFTAADADFNFVVFSLNRAGLFSGINGINTQRQENAVDSLSLQKANHSLKFGVDFRHLDPKTNARAYTQGVFFNDVTSAGNGNVNFSLLEAARPATLSFDNLGVFAQDTWRPIQRVTLTYGLRWDVDVAPSSDPAMLAITGYNLQNLSNLNVAPHGTPSFQTPYNGIAPRLGAAYQLFTNQKWQAVLRGGFGVFYDLADSEIDNLISQGGYPFAAISEPQGGTFPLSASTAQPPPILAPGNGAGVLLAFDPHLRLPYTLEWNLSAEQSLGSSQALSVSYVGAAGRSLIQTSSIFNPNPNFASALLVGNSGTSDYHALQVQFARKMSHGLQAVASYTWAHAIDTGSAGSYGNAANLVTPGVSNRGPSDFDIRDAASAGITYDLPKLDLNRFAEEILNGWSFQSSIQVRSAEPVNVSNEALGLLSNTFTAVRPDVVPGQSFYLYGSTCVSTLGPPCAGGKGFNPAAFTNPPVDANGNPLRQGDLGRNALRGFGAAEWDFAVHRDFALRESVNLQFRAELFNLLNHPNFGPPGSDLSGFSGPFGQATQMLGRSFDQSPGGGSFSSLYQIGGPRSIQFALKISF